MSYATSDKHLASYDAGFKAWSAEAERALAKGVRAAAMEMLARGGWSDDELRHAAKHRADDAGRCARALLAALDALPKGGGTDGKS